MRVFRVAVWLCLEVGRTYLSAPARRRVAGAGGASTGGSSVLVAALLFRGGDDGELESMAAAAARGAGNRLGSIQNNLLERLPAIFTNVFVNRLR